MNQSASVLSDCEVDEALSKDALTRSMLSPLADFLSYQRTISTPHNLEVERQDCAPKNYRLYLVKMLTVSCRDMGRSFSCMSQL